MEKYLDLYSIDRTWEDLDSTSRDSLTRIAQLDSYSGGYAAGIAEELGIGAFAWYYPGFDSTVVLPDSTDTLEDEEIGERIANSQNEPYSPGLTNVNGEAGKFSLYPNPSCGNFIVESQGVAMLIVMSLEGRIIAQYELAGGKNEISLPKIIASGIYTVQYKSDGRPPVNKKLIYQP